MTQENKERYPVPVVLANWLEGGEGRAAYFHRLDPLLTPSLISKMKKGVAAISFEYALRLERAQKASPDPLKAEDLATYQQDRALIRWVRGIDPTPAQVPTPPVGRTARRVHTAT